MTEAHDLLLASQHGQEPLASFLRALETLDERHGCLVGTAMQRAAQGADGRGHRRIKIGQGSRAHPGGKRGSVELVLGVEDQ